jgi:post-segregation antitoxin (ccd killing protein)
MKEQTMEQAPVDEGVGKCEVRISISSDLLAKARALRIDTSGVAEAAIARAVQSVDREAVLAGIRKDREVLARYIAEHGDPVAELREMYGTP